MVLGVSPQRLARLPLRRAGTSRLRSAVAEEEQELHDAIRPSAARRQDAVAAVAALVVVITVSVMMERAASALGSRLAISEVVVGGLILAAVTSLPNAVAAIYLANRGRGAATLSTALNSNALNVSIGLLVRPPSPALAGPRARPADRSQVHRADSGSAGARSPRPRLRPGRRILVIAAYLAFAGSLLASVYVRWHPYWIAAAAAAALAMVLSSRLAIARQVAAGGPQPGGRLYRQAALITSAGHQDRAAEPLRGLSRLRRVGRRNPFCPAGRSDACGSSA